MVQKYLTWTQAISISIHLLFSAHVTVCSTLGKTQIVMLFIKAQKHFCNEVEEKMLPCVGCGGEIYVV